MSVCKMIMSGSKLGMKITYCQRLRGILNQCNDATNPGEQVATTLMLYLLLLSPTVNNAQN